jgi:perosamine synthetase
VTFIKKFNTIDHEEAEAADAVIRLAHATDRPLSGYLGSRIVGGFEANHLEKEWAETFGVKYAVAVNSGTSGLLAACMAIGIEHGDEVIVSPYTMSATAAVPKILGATIVFADIEPDTFTIDPVEVSNAITPKTKAVIATNLFGHPAHLRELRDICDGLGVYLIEDNAQAIFSRENGVYTGTIGHIGVFSLNVHKHIQVGEGGICVTNIDHLDAKLSEAMNHGEMRGGILGLNLRMTEVTAAMARMQLKKAPDIMNGRRLLAGDINSEILKREIPITIPNIRNKCRHSFYCWAGLMEKEPKCDIPKPFKRGYMHPIYSLPAFASKQTISLPVVESIEKRIVLLEVCSIDPTEEQITKMVKELGKAL